MTNIPSVYVWLIVLIICLVAEAATTQLVSLWFAAGSVGAMIAAKLGLGLTGQLAVFLLLSFILLLALRPVLSGILRPNPEKTNADRILDQTAVVIQTIDNQKESGQIRMMGQTWTARSFHDNEIIPEGETVVVRDISGVKAIVERCKTNGGK